MDPNVSYTYCYMKGVIFDTSSEFYTQKEEEKIASNIQSMLMLVESIDYIEPENRLYLNPYDVRCSPLG